MNTALARKKRPKQNKDDKDLSLRNKFLENIKKYFGDREGVIIPDPKNIVIEKFPTGSLKLDVHLKGGYPKGKFIECFGWEGCGKTSACIEAVAQHQKKYPDENILWVDLEGVFDKDYFAAIGVDISPEKFILADPDSSEDAYVIMLEFMNAFKGGIIVVDSVPTLLPEKERASDIGDAKMALAARANSEGVRKVLPKSKKNGTTIFWINQYRANIGTMSPKKTTTTGGNVFRYFSRTRLELGSGNSNQEDVVKIYVHLEKSNYGHHKAKFETEIIFGKGWDYLGELVDLAEEAGIIEKHGSWYSQGETKLGQGKNQVKELFEDNEEFRQEIEDKVKEHFGI